MSNWTPDWALEIDGYGDYTNITLANLTISSGRTDIYSQPRAGYANFQILNLDLSPVEIDVNDSITIKVKDSTGEYVNLFGGSVTDRTLEVISSAPGQVNEVISVTALGALSKLPKAITAGVLSKDFDGNQIYSILSQVLFDSWSEVPAALDWDAYDPTITWANAENSGLGTIDQPGNYELTARASNATDIYSLVSDLANSGLGYIYEDAQGRINYADSTHRTVYLTDNGYSTLSGNTALSKGIKTVRRLGDLRNQVTIKYKSNAETTASDASSIELYGAQAQVITTSIENLSDAEEQADFYLSIRAFPQDVFDSVTFSLGNPEISDADRDLLLNVFMGLPLDIVDLPSNMVGGRFQGFVEGWKFQAGYNRLDITLNVSPIAYSLQAMNWTDVGASETWNTISTTLDWTSATIVA
jgi:hypothetical protein